MKTVLFFFVFTIGLFFMVMWSLTKENTVDPVQTSAVEENDIELPEGKHRDLVHAQCSGCHSLKLVVQNRMTRKKWDETITWMQDEQNFWQLTPGVRSDILDYLETHLSPTNAAGPNLDVLPPPTVNPLL